MTRFVRQINQMKHFTRHSPSGRRRVKKSRQALTRPESVCPSQQMEISGKSTKEYGRGRRKAIRVGKNTLLFFDYENKFIQRFSFSATL